MYEEVHRLLAGRRREALAVAQQAAAGDSGMATILEMMDEEPMAVHVPQWFLKATHHSKPSCEKCAKCAWCGIYCQRRKVGHRHHRCAVCQSLYHKEFSASPRG